MLSFVYQDVELSELGLDELCQVCYADGIADVELMGDDVGEAEGLAEGLDGVEAKLGVTGGENDGDALLGEETGGCEADAFVGSGDDRAASEERWLLLRDAFHFSVASETETGEDFLLLYFREFYFPTPVHQ